MSGVAAIASLLAVACQPRLPAGGPIGELDAGSTLLGCDVADQFLTVDADAHLDPACTYTAGVEVVASDTTLDCRGARIVDLTDDQSRGIHVHVPVCPRRLSA